MLGEPAIDLIPCLVGKFESVVPVQVLNLPGEFLVLELMLFLFRESVFPHQHLFPVKMTAEVCGEHLESPGQRVFAHAVEHRVLEFTGDFVKTLVFLVDPGGVQADFIAPYHHMCFPGSAVLPLFVYQEQEGIINPHNHVRGGVVGHAAVVVANGNRTQGFMFTDELPHVPWLFGITDNPELIPQHACRGSLIGVAVRVVFIGDGPGDLFTAHAHGVHHRIGTGPDEPVFQGGVRAPGDYILFGIQFPGGQGDVHVGGVVADAENRSPGSPDSGIHEHRIAGAVAQQHRVSLGACGIDMIRVGVDDDEIDSRFMEFPGDGTPGTAETAEEVVIPQFIDAIGHLASPVKVGDTRFDDELADSGDKGGSESQSEEYDDDGEDPSGITELPDFSESYRGDGDYGHIKGLEEAPVLFYEIISQSPGEQDDEKAQEKAGELIKTSGSPGFFGHRPSIRRNRRRRVRFFPRGAGAASAGIGSHGAVESPLIV